MADVYRRTGRGGAGNFYSQKDVEEATKAADSSKDLEAQKQHQQPPADEIPTDPADPPSQHTTTTTSDSNNGAYARTGRGGAGNFVDPVTAAASSPSSPPASPSSTATPAPATVARSGLSGRGGAGNWTTVPGEGEDGGGGGAVYDPEQERKRREALDAHILQDIRDSLPQPPRIHYMHGPGRGRKPDLSPTS
ncbi:hypothetical protein F4820DRAFT_277723 [Hypoxylon rubiginosum]|uniref:Uncharacterized protein n=1 Tax=Hypoxylon rubiginosum TaxID=110542 RepID=A0ACB9Z289_9PEZI|nr:hypothetical protein F4820DRAFT_277723 [Hypoxylon rubiginosum]